MGKIIGEHLEEWVAEQITQRQTKHGLQNRSTSDLAYLNSKTSWVKLASGVNINDDRLREEGISMTSGFGLAANRILFAGTSRHTTSGTPLTQRSGTAPFSADVNTAYGLGGPEFGLVPMPGIESVEVQYMNRGSIKKATVKVKAYNSEQFNFIDLLYLRLGYTVLLEWGNSIYIDNSGSVKTMGATLSETGFFDYLGSYNEYLPKIQDMRSKHEGNYDGFLAKVTNFDWKFTPEGTYDITIQLISMGDIVESLKMNLSPDMKFSDFVNANFKLFAEENDLGSEEEDANPSPADNMLSSYLFLFKLYTAQQDNSRFTRKDISISIDGQKIDLGALWLDFPSGITNIYSPDFKNNQDVFYLNYNNGEDMGDSINDMGFYMRFGHLLQFIKENLIPKIKDKSTPIIDINYDMWDNWMYLFPHQISLDPRVCLVKSTLNNINAFPEIVDWKKETQDIGYAWTMNIYLNFSQIQASLDENKDEKGDVSLMGFLSSICNAINKALGGVNNLEPVIDEEANTIRIIDSSYASEKIESAGYLLEVFGYNGSQSNFVRNFDLKTAITPEYATMVTVGSTSGGYIKGTEGTMFSKWNTGLTDRFKQELIPANSTTTPDPDEPLRNYVQNFYQRRTQALGYTVYDIDSWSAFITNSQTPALNNEIIDKNIAIVTEFYKYCQYRLQKQYPKYASPINGFIPFSLGLTLDGISGMKIYNEIVVDTRFLPKNYPESLRFIITGVKHKLDNQDWETTIETMVIPQHVEQ